MRARFGQEFEKYRRSVRLIQSAASSSSISSIGTSAYLGVWARHASEVVVVLVFTVEPETRS
jgi:hypothetical protein